MPVLTLLHLTLLITFVRWLLITILQHHTCWILQNILVSFNHDHMCFLIILFFYLCALLIFVTLHYFRH